MKKEDKINTEKKIDILEIAIEANKLSIKDKERLYFMIKGMQLANDMENVQEVMQRA